MKFGTFHLMERPFSKSESQVYDEQLAQMRLADEIGFDWKEYLFGPPARYVTYSDRTFLVRDVEGYYYKLRFLDFYNDQGIRGFPTMEYVRF